MNFDDYLALNQLYADYAIAVDSGQWDLWPEFFTDDCVYRLQPRENFDRELAYLFVLRKEYDDAEKILKSIREPSEFLSTLRAQLAADRESARRLKSP